MARSLWDRLLGRPESFTLGSPSSASSYAAWLGLDTTEHETVSAQTVLGLSAVIRSVWIISTTIAGLPLRTYERQGDERERVPSVFDDPFPGIEGMTPFAWVETVLIHLLLWRRAFLWHDERETRTGFVTSYRPLHPDQIEKVQKIGGKFRFTIKEELTDGSTDTREVGTEMVTYIPGPSIDGVTGMPFLQAARRIFSGALSGDHAAQKTLRQGIRLAGLVTPAEGEDDFDPTEGEAILETLRAKVVGREHAGDVALINRKLKLQPWTPTNIEAQWNESRMFVLGEIERLFGMPPHLLADTEKQTSWGTGVAEQNLGLARYTLRGWSDRIEQVLTRRLPAEQFCEFDYRGLLQGTPEQEIKLLLEQVKAGVITKDEYRRIQNLPPMTPAQKVETAQVRGSVFDTPSEVAA